MTASSYGILYKCIVTLLTTTSQSIPIRFRLFFALSLPLDEIGPSGHTAGTSSKKRKGDVPLTVPSGQKNFGVNQALAIWWQKCVY
jgi:hypothetical protein